MAPGKDRKGIWVSPETLARVERLKIVPEEPAWRVVERLLDSWDVSHTKNPPAPAETPAAVAPA